MSRSISDLKFTAAQARALVIKSEKAPRVAFEMGTKLDFALIEEDTENFEKSVIFNEGGRKLDLQTVLGFLVEEGTDIIKDGEDELLPFQGKRQTVRQLLLDGLEDDEELSMIPEMTLVKRVAEGATAGFIEKADSPQDTINAYAAKKIVHEGRENFPALYFNKRDPKSDVKNHEHYNVPKRLMVQL